MENQAVSGLGAQESYGRGVEAQVSGCAICALRIKLEKSRDFLHDSTRRSNTEDFIKIRKLCSSMIQSQGIDRIDNLKIYLSIYISMYRNIYVYKYIKKA